MNFIEAVKARCNGKTVMDTDEKYKLEGTGTNIEIYDMEVSDFKKLNKYIVQLTWKIVEEKKTLSDMIVTADGLHHEVKVCIEENVKERIHAFIDLLKAEGHFIKHIEKGANELFGEKLT